jgi:HAD superfamily hydrolase (TIGR01509 family)
VSLKKAWLVDVWETLVTIDFSGMLATLAAIGEVSVECLGAAASAHIDPVAHGEMSIGDAFIDAIASCGTEVTAELATVIRNTQQEYLLANAAVFDDAVSFITRSRQRGDLIALVSNCGDDTRPLLESRGFVDLVDEVVLSCEVGAAKPARQIFDHTVATLGVQPSQATLIDDQYGFCEGAVAAGLRAIQLVRQGDPEPALSSAIGTVRSFDEIE